MQQLTSVAGLSSKLDIVALQNSKKTLLSPLYRDGSADWSTLLANRPTSALALNKCHNQRDDHRGGILSTIASKKNTHWTKTN